MRAALPAAIAAMLLAGAAPLEGQDHPEQAKAAHSEPVKAAPPVPTVVPPKAKNVNLTPTIPPAKVAAAVAEALRQAEEAAASGGACPRPGPGLALAWPWPGPGLTRA